MVINEFISYLLYIVHYVKMCNVNNINGKRKYARSIRNHDYLFDNTFVVSGEKDHNKMINRVVLTTAEVSIKPIFQQMFSDLQSYPRVTKVCTMNSRLPQHFNLSYADRLTALDNSFEIKIDGKNRYKYFSTPKIISTNSNNVDTDNSNLPPKPSSASIQISPKGALMDKSVQTMYRESSTQTDPYQPEYKQIEGFNNNSEILQLENLYVDPKKIVNGDVDKKTVFWINRLRIRNAWMEIQPASNIIAQLELYERTNREREIENILLHNLNNDKNYFFNNLQLDTDKPKRMWIINNEKLQTEIRQIEKKHERDIRKIENMKRMKDNKAEYIVSWIPCNVGQHRLVSINSDFLPAYEDIAKKSFTFEKKKKHHELQCSKNKNIKLLTNIKKIIKNEMGKVY